MLALGISILFLSACKKENPEISYSEQEPIYKFPTKKGSYWVYQWYSIDSVGNEIALNQTDSLKIIGDSILNGKTYAIYKQKDFSSNQVTYLQRDSSGYIVNENGEILFTYVDFNTKFNVGSESNLWDYYGHYLNTSFTVFVPAGIFQTRASEYYIYSPTGNSINQCGDTAYSFKTYYASGIGEVLKETAYLADFHSKCQIREKRLIAYFIPE